MVDRGDRASSDVASGAVDISGGRRARALAASLLIAALLLRVLAESFSKPLLSSPSELLLCVRSCCFMLSLRVKALLQTGQRTPFSPVCFFPCRAACPEVVNVAEQVCEMA